VKGDVNSTGTEPGPCKSECNLLGVHLVQLKFVCGSNVPQAKNGI
jgi:hypothetical protein